MKLKLFLKKLANHVRQKSANYIVGGWISVSLASALPFLARQYHLLADKIEKVHLILPTIRLWITGTLALAFLLYWLEAISQFPNEKFTKHLGLLWDENLNPHCTNCERYLLNSHSQAYWDEFLCRNCKGGWFYIFHPEKRHKLSLKEAQNYIRETKIPVKT